MAALAFGLVILLLFTGSDSFKHWKYRGFLSAIVAQLIVFIGLRFPAWWCHSSILFTFSLSRSLSHAHWYKYFITTVASLSVWAVLLLWLTSYSVFDQWSVLAVEEMTGEREREKPAAPPPTQDTTPPSVSPRSARSELWSTTEPLSLSPCNHWATTADSPTERTTNCSLHHDRPRNVPINFHWAIEHRISSPRPPVLVYWNKESLN